MDPIYGDAEAARDAVFLMLAGDEALAGLGFGCDRIMVTDSDHPGAPDDEPDGLQLHWSPMVVSSSTTSSFGGSLMVAVDARGRSNRRHDAAVSDRPTPVHPQRCPLVRLGYRGTPSIGHA